MVKYQKKGMKHFICGNIKYKHFLFKGRELIIKDSIKSDSLEEIKRKKTKLMIKENNYEIKEIEKKELSIESREYQIERLREKNEILIEELKNPKIPQNKFNKFIKDFRPTKEIHGFSGILLNNKKVIIAFHTSQDNSTIFGINDKNIKLHEDLNRIKGINKPCEFEIEDLKYFFKISDPKEMLSSPRYGENKIEDMAHCSYRALVHSIKQSNTLIKIEFDKVNKELIEIIQKQDYSVDTNKIITTPTETEIGIEKEMVEYNLIDDMRLLERDDDGYLRRELVKNSIINYNEIFK